MQSLGGVVFTEEQGFFGKFHDLGVFHNPVELFVVQL